MEWLVEGNQPGDKLFFGFDGHGTQVEDEDGDEGDAIDEAICPVEGGEIPGLKNTCSLFPVTSPLYIASPPHSSIVIDPITDDELNDILVKPLVEGVVLHALVDCCHSGSILDLQHVYKIDNETGELDWDTEHDDEYDKGTSGGRVICISGCMDDESSYDTDVFTEQVQTSL